MTREDVVKIFPNATEEQITSFLNKTNSEVKDVKEKNKELKDATKELEDAKAEIEKLKEQVEKKSNAPDDWQAQIDKLTEQNNANLKTIKNMQLKAQLIEKGFSPEDADGFIQTMDGGGDMADFLGKMKDNLISAHDKEQLRNTPDPSGSGSTPPKDEKSTAEKLATEIYGDSNNTKQADIFANYK